MGNKLRTTIYIWSVMTLGAFAFVFALSQMTSSILRWDFLFLSFFTIVLGSRITLPIPHFKSHIAVSDTFIFLALILYGGESAILLAVIEAFCSAWRFCNKKITVFFNAGVMSLSVTAVVWTLRLVALDMTRLMHDDYTNYTVGLSLIAFTMYLVNSGLASVYGALKSEKPIWQTWKTYYLWTSVTYFTGAIATGVLAKLVDKIGFVVLLATAPVIAFIYFTYRMYLKNVEMSVSQAEQAEKHASILQEQSSALQESEERFRSAFDYAPIGIALVSPAGRWLKVNKSLCDIVGYTEEELLQTDFQSITFKDDLGDALVQLHELTSEKSPTCQTEKRYIHKSGKEVWVHWSASTTTDSKSEKPNLIFQIQDITARKHVEEKLQYDATHDTLTGLPNRLLFTTRLEQAIQRAKENSGHKVSVLFIDLDRFKVVNDSLGHTVGDKLLVEIAGRLRDCVRTSETVARLGGDEFTILVEGEFESEEIVSIAERIKEKFAIPFNLGSNEIYSSASIGIIHSSSTHTKPEDLMRDADIAMYQAKRSGKARHEVFNQELHKEARETLQLENDLRRAIEKEDLCVEYQPIISLEKGALEGFEALVRWNHKSLGVVSPAKFVSLAEETGLIDSLGELVLRKACQQGKRWQEMFPECVSLMISVNLSCKQFAQANMVQNIQKVLEETKFNPHQLKLEITESVLLEHKENAIEMLHQLRALGIEINIDDFGTGYSNLNYLSQLPVSTLKIDRSFISPAKSNRSDEEIVQTIVNLARNLGMKVIAEGVETETQLEQLKALNCEGAQGYYFSKPMAVDAATEFLANKHSQVLNLTELQNYENIPVIQTIQ